MLKQSFKFVDDERRGSELITTTCVASSGLPTVDETLSTPCLSGDINAPITGDYTMFNSQPYTFTRAERVYNTNINRRRSPDKKLTNLTYLRKKSEDEYNIVYDDGELLIKIFRTHWEVGVRVGWILYPGLTSRVSWFTGCNLFRGFSSRYPGWYLGSIANPLRKSDDPCDCRSYAVLDYTHKYKACYNPALVRTSESHINGRRESRTGGYYWGSTMYGRSKAVFHNCDSQIRLMKDVIKKYVMNYLGSYTAHRTPHGFDEFISEPKLEYTPGDTYSNYYSYGNSREDSGPYRVDRMDEIPGRYLAVDPNTGASSFLYSKSKAHNLYDPRSFLCDNTDMGSGELIQSMYLLRGYSPLIQKEPDGKIRVDGPLLDAPVDVYNLTPYDDKFGNSRGNYYNIRSRLKVLASERTRRQLSVRSHFYKLWLNNMMVWSPGGHPKCRPPNGLVPPEDLDGSTNRHDHRYGPWTGGYRYNQNDERSMLCNQTGIRVFDFSVGVSEYRWSYPSVSQLSDDNYLRDPVPLFGFKNPFPRIFFFLMYDEYCSSSILDKHTLTNMLRQEWESMEGGETYDVMEDKMRLSIEVMVSFLEKRNPGIFMKLLSTSPTEFMKIYFHGSTRGYSGNSWQDHAQPVGVPLETYLPDNFVDIPETVVDH